ncbi:Tail Collar domain protein [Candidatus Sulfopaludibacter sp. SbA3]|nr:Tail Collar domain protein [Candidatus Sulfopaludibacter sp. SbA3]
MFGGNFAPSGWALCNGQLMSISQNAALFSILGTTYGGDGIQTFALPDLQGRVAVHQGTGAGLSPYILGEKTGVQNVTLLYNNMPVHTHLVNADGAASGKNTPQANLLGTVGISAQDKVYSGGTGSTTMNPAMIAPAGGNVPISVIQPLLCVTFIIALNGIFPSRG